MMDIFRRHARGWVTKVLMGFLIFSFAIWGISDVFRRFADTDVVRVGSQRIELEPFREIYRERLRVLGSQVGRNIANDQARALGLDRQILSEVIAENTFDESGRSLGLRISDADLIKRIHANPAFLNASGQFDPNRFEEVLRANNYSEARYLAVERRFALRQQIGRAITGDILAPEVLGNAIRRFESEERSVQFVRLDKNSAGAIPTPTPEQVSEYYDSRKAAFRAPEYRKLSILPLTPDAVQGLAEVSDADLRKAFDAQKDRIAVPERREVQQMLFPNVEEARAGAQKINGGATFEGIATERGLSANDISLGTVTRRDISDPAIAEAAFKLPEGKLSDPVQGRFGVALVRVAKIVPGKEPNFADYTDTIRKQLTAERARRSILDLHDKIEDERASGSNLSEAAAKTKVKLISIDAIDRSGRAPDGKRIENVPGLDQILATAFTTDVGTEADPVEMRDVGGYAWFEVAGITPSRERPLDEVRERVVERWRDDEAARRLEERAEAMKKRLDANDKFEAVATGLKVETREKLMRDKPADGIDADALAAIFETAQGKAGISVGDDRISRVVFRVTAVNTPAAGGQVSQRTATLAGTLQDDLLVQYVMRLQEQIGVRVNDANFRNATGATGN
jgi:peptidyl-prolyl cis-trans isomerase D